MKMLAHVQVVDMVLMLISTLTVLLVPKLAQEVAVVEQLVKMDKVAAMAASTEVAVAATALDVTQEPDKVGRV
jgi:competence protein ComGC